MFTLQAAALNFPSSYSEALGPKYSHHDNYPIAEELYKTYSTSSNYELFPDALQFLESIQRLRKDGNITVGALTNFDRRIHDVVKLLGLSSKLDFVLCSEDAKSSKPESDIFLAGLKCASRHGTEGTSSGFSLNKIFFFMGKQYVAIRVGPIDAREILHIGDDIANDYEGARRVGWNALLINRKNGDAISGVDSAHICRDFNVVARKLGLEIK